MPWTKEEVKYHTDLFESGKALCTCCSVIKAVSEFNKKSKARFGLSHKCKLCSRVDESNKSYEYICASCNVIFQNDQKRSKCFECIPRRINWTFEQCKVEAAKYTYRRQFQNESKGAYLHARSKGWLDSICGHMFPLSGGFNATRFVELCAIKNVPLKLYLLKCFNNEERFYKIGVTSRSISRRYGSKKEMPYSYKILWIIEGDPRETFDLEAKFKLAITDIKYQPKLWPTKHSKETFKCHGNCRILRKPKL